MLGMWHVLGDVLRRCLSREESCPFCPPLAFKVQRGGVRRGLLALREHGFRVPQCYSGTDPGAGSGFGRSDLGHLSATRPGPDGASKPRQQQDLFSCGGWGVGYHLRWSLQLTSRACPWSTGPASRELWASPTAPAVFPAHARTPLTFLRARSWPGLAPASAQGLHVGAQQPPDVGSRQLGHLQQPDAVPSPSP